MKIAIVLYPGFAALDAIGPTLRRVRCALQPTRSRRRLHQGAVKPFASLVLSVSLALRRELTFVPTAASGSLGSEQRLAAEDPNVRSI